MLRKLDSIKACGIFEDYRWGAGLPDLARINVIYGSNGTGKTSLSDALDGLRNADDGKGYKKLSVTIDDNGTSIATNGNDNPFFERVHVFSECYVSRSHKFTPAEAEMTAVLTIGEKAADVEKQLEYLRTTVAAKTAERDAAVDTERAANQAIETTYSRVSQQVVDAASKAGGRYHSRSNFSTRMVRTMFGQDHATWTELTKQEFQEKTGIINADKAEALPEEELVVSVPDDIRHRISAALGTTPSTIILDTLQTHPDATEWVDQGRHHHEGVDTCIFCGSSLSDERRSQIDQHFSDAVQQLQRELRGIMTELASIESKVESSLRAVPSKGLFLEDLRARYDESEGKLREELGSLQAWTNGVKKRLEAKLANVLMPVDPEVDAPSTVEGKEFIKLRDEHNDRVSKHDEVVQAAAKAVELHYLKKGESEVAGKKAESVKQKAAADKLNEELLKLTNQVTALEAVDGDPTPSAKVLTEEVARLLGRNELKFEAVDGKYQVTRDGEPATGLSVGERTAVTLVHFLEVVARCDACIGKPIVVIDDPVSSLDNEIFMGVSTYIWNEAVVKDHIAQLILLTHNFELFRQWDIQIEALHNSGRDKTTSKKMRDLCPASFYELKSKHVTRLSKTRRSPVIAEWPPTEATRKKVRSTYHHAFIATVDKLKDLQADDSMENRLDAQLLFPNVIRRMLETFLAFKHPEWVGNFTLAMHNSADLLREAGYQGDAGALRLRLTRYTHAYSHSESPATDTTVSPDEVKTAIEAVFEFMNQIDGPHFAGLCIVTGVDPKDVLPAASDELGAVEDAQEYDESKEEV
ncbi:MAG: AAA family ATPase [Actinobacteria bacterium]|nr:AAA family ATPase [Actinomycetota bacterium]